MLVPESVDWASNKEHAGNPNDSSPSKASREQRLAGEREGALGIPRSNGFVLGYFTIISLSKTLQRSC